MYYPYFRGRQNELLCLRELLENDKLSEKVIPVIEPVRFNSTLFSTLSKFIEKDRNIIIITNPEVGKFNEEYNDKILQIKKSDESKQEKLRNILENYKKIINDDHIKRGYIVKEDIIERIRNGKIKSDLSYFFNRDKGNYSFYLEYGEELKAEKTFIPKDEDFKDEVYGDTVILEDVYNKARRNIDYINKPDEFFSKNHLIYDKRGYQGFSDYSVVGDVYEETGFAPLAIAIHIVYFDKKKVLRIHHFVSDSNENISDPARKFEEAMDKLIKWDGLVNVKQTNGLSNLISYYKQGRFPGLGVIKKYSLMHHIELIGDFLEKKYDLL